MKRSVAKIIIVLIALFVVSCHYFKKDITRVVTYHDYIASTYLYDDGHTYRDTFTIFYFKVYFNDKGWLLQYPDDTMSGQMYLAATDAIYDIDKSEKTVRRQSAASISNPVNYITKDSILHITPWGKVTRKELCTSGVWTSSTDTFCDSKIWLSDKFTSKSEAAFLFRMKSRTPTFPTDQLLLRIESINRDTMRMLNQLRIDEHNIIEAIHLDETNVPDRISSLDSLIKTRRIVDTW